MESLYSQRGNFLQACWHIGSLREPLSPTFQSIVTDDLKTSMPDVRKQFNLWNVPNIKQVVGTGNSVEVHGNAIFIDEADIKRKAMPIGCFRQTLFAGVSRQTMGGRKTYDFVNMNVALLGGYLFGAGCIKLHTWFEIKRLQALRAPLGFIGFGFGFAATKYIWKSFGIATLFVEHHFRKGSSALNCETCLAEVQANTQHKIEQRNVEKLTGGQHTDAMKMELAALKQLYKEGKFKGKQCCYHNGSVE
eukprot:PhF_6_TR4999/c0_g1_i1/m.7075